MKTVSLLSEHVYYVPIPALTADDDNRNICCTIHCFLKSTQEDSDPESEVGDTPRPKKRRRGKSKKKTGIYDLYEPSELERGHFLERDAEIRVTDMPERFQTRSIPVKPSEEGELEEEAEWVFEHAFVKSPISKQVSSITSNW